MSLEPIQIAFFHDVLCGYCCVVAERLECLKREFGEALSVKLRPYLLHPEEASLSAKEIRRVVRHVRQAAREPEGQHLRPDLWLGDDRPLSSLPALVAAEAALRQGPEAQQVLLRRMRDAAFLRGINVARRDVLLELAWASGLDVGRFQGDFDRPSVREAVLASHEDAVSKRVRSLPAVAVADAWLLTGMRKTFEYREAIVRWLEAHQAASALRTVH